MAIHRKFCGLFSYRLGLFIISPITFIISAVGLYFATVRRDFFSPFLPSAIIILLSGQYFLWVITSGVGAVIAYKEKRKVARNLTFIVVCLCGFSLIITGTHIIMMVPHQQELEDTCVREYSYSVGNGTSDKFHGWSGSYFNINHLAVQPTSYISHKRRAPAPTPTTAPSTATGGGGKQTAAGGGTTTAESGNGGGGATTSANAPPRATSSANVVPVVKHTPSVTAAVTHSPATPTMSIAPTTHANVNAIAAGNTTAYSSTAVPICERNIKIYYGEQVAWGLVCTFLQFYFSATFARYVGELDERHHMSQQSLVKRGGSNEMTRISVDSLEFEHSDPQDMRGTNYV